MLVRARTASATTVAGLFLLCLANLTFEILLTRIFSVTMWYHFAFLAISVGMFGMTVGSVLVYLLPGFFTEERAPHQLTLASFLFGLSVPCSLLTHLSVPFTPELTVLGLYSVLLTYVALAVPFTFSGIAVCIALTKFPAQVSVLYAADLAGAAAGCVLLVGLLGITDGPTAVFVVALLGLVSTVLFALASPGRRLLWTSVIATAALAAVVAPHLLGTASEPLVRLKWVKDKLEQPPLYEKWNSFSRIRVFGDPGKWLRPFGWGLNFADPNAVQPVHQMMLDIDATAGTPITEFTGNLAGIKYLKYDLVHLAHYLRPNSSVLVIGTGGGRDILAALAFEQPRIRGVEINGDIIKTVNEHFGDFTGHLDRHPAVTFVNDEARSYVARQTEKFDIIQISLIDTWAATAAGAFVLAENSLYTVEGFKTFLEHLTPNGVFTVSRWWYGDLPGEIYRTLSLATAALKEMGVEQPSDHLMLARTMWSPSRGSGTLLISPQPFTAADVERIERVVAKLGFEIMLTPNAAANEDLATLATGADVDAFLDRYPLDLRPTTDDTPFFFQMLRLRDIGAGTVEQGQNTFNVYAVVILGTILAVVTVLTVLCILLPLALSRGPRPSRATIPLFVFFGAIGLGFMLVEVSLMQRLIVFLGHPIYSLSVVLFSLLLAGGIGSFLTGSIRADGPRRAMLVPLGLLLCAVAVVGVALPVVVSRFDGVTTPGRIGIALGMLVPLGIFMGMAFPIGLKLASTRAENLTAWLWGINGATSVWASVLAVAIALSTRISAAFWTGWFCYLIAFGALLWATRGVAVGHQGADESIATTPIVPRRKERPAGRGRA